jgi:hypothetical protein
MAEVKKLKAIYWVYLIMLLYKGTVVGEVWVQGNK